MTLALCCTLQRFSLADFFFWVVPSQPFVVLAVWTRDVTKRVLEGESSKQAQQHTRLWLQTAGAQTTQARPSNSLTHSHPVFFLRFNEGGDQSMWEAGQRPILVEFAHGAVCRAEKEKRAKGLWRQRRTTQLVTKARKEEDEEVFTRGYKTGVTTKRRSRREHGDEERKQSPCGGCDGDCNRPRGRSRKAKPSKAATQAVMQTRRRAAHGDEDDDDGRWTTNDAVVERVLCGCALKRWLLTARRNNRTVRNETWCDASQTKSNAAKRPEQKTNDATRGC